jgi:hypothetical protein
MKITLNNVDSLLEEELEKICDVVPINENPDGCFVKWVESNHEQIKCIKYCIDKHKPLIIFDGDQLMTDDEVTFLMGHGVFLWEPYLNDRTLFSYQPNWGKIPIDIPWDFEKAHPIDFGCVLPLKGLLPTFEKYYHPISVTGEYNVSYFNENISDVIRKKVSDMGVSVFDTSNSLSSGKINMKFSMVLCTNHQYKTGYFPSHIFELLENGVVPLLPEEHKWYYSIFQEMVIKNSFDIEFLIKTYDNIGYGLIHQIYQSIDKYLPESNVVNVAKRIKSFIS